VTHLYRLYDSSDALLYVGISKSAITRLHEHLALQPWSAQIVKQTIERFPSRDAAAAAEIRAIRDEMPRYNKMHNPAAVACETSPTSNGYGHLFYMTRLNCQCGKRLYAQEIHVAPPKKDRPSMWSSHFCGHCDRVDFVEYVQGIAPAVTFARKGWRIECPTCADRVTECDQKPPRYIEGKCSKCHNDFLFMGNRTYWTRDKYTAVSSEPLQIVYL
jgi:hypothetical protein